MFAGMAYGGLPKTGLLYGYAREASGSFPEPVHC